MSKKEIPDFIVKFFIPLLSAWLIWVTKAVVSLQADVAVIKYGVFKTVAKTEEPKAQRKPSLDADLDLFGFIQRKIK